MGQLKNRGIGLKDKLESGKTYYEIRLESIGGLGANLCGKMLGELGVKYLDVNSSNFSSYGSEKTGTPVKGFIRYCKKEKELREHSPVVEPDLLVVFHQALLKDVSIWKGCGEETAVIIALEPGQEQPEITGCNYDACYGLEAQKIAMETHSRINVVMLGAVLKIMGIENLSVGEQICKDTLGKKYPDALKANLEGMKRGYEEVRRLEKKAEQKQKDNQFQGKELHKANATEHKSLKQSDWGYANAPLGGVNPNFGSTVVADLSPSRQGYIPLFIQERCINCGLCYSACPDMVFQFAKGEYKGREMMVNQGLDYYHCKGCLRCVDVCPVNALVRGVEAEHPKKEYFMPNQELLRMPEYYEEAGPDGYITSESYLTEKRMEGGEV
ncbi:MAG: 2-oxoacid:acceptor oxidoreductase family protein [Lachnospiraceae bacterium]|nr:2-oxoacid:acceptor oxidoreductase family protein [Lachnospiraceae bacterium]